MAKSEDVRREAGDPTPDTDEQADRRTDGWTERRTDGPKDRWMDGPRNGRTDRPTDGPKDGRIHGQTDQQRVGPRDGPTDRTSEGGMDRRTLLFIDARTDVRKMTLTTLQRDGETENGKDEYERRKA